MPAPHGPLAGKRMLVVEEALKSESGHWFEYVRSVKQLNAAAGAETVVVVHKDAQPDVVAALEAHALFPWTNWDGIYNHPQAWRRYLGIVQHNWRVFRLMRGFVARHGPFDIVFAPTVVIHHVFGWRWLMAAQGHRIGQIVLLFRNNAGSYEPGRREPVFKRSTAVLRWALRSFAPLIARGRARFATDSAKLALEYRLLCGIEPQVFPSPRVSPPPPLEEATRAPDAPVTFACLGPARFEKGIDVMQEAIRRFLAAHPQARARFVIQWNQPILDESGALYEPDPALVADPRVDLITEAMSSERYDAEVAATDCMLLPYRRASYYARISGVAVEAVTAGVPLIYTRDTWCEDLVADVGEGIGVDDGDVDGLAQAIARMVADFPAISARARAKALAARESHSGEAFTAALWGLGGHG
ncbi:glycosyltransferase [Alteraurantiacibacter buctensis]|uniref:Glycosyltransferase n=1 Tax=Alteraurantiacibacter buctensis TaxID=1503981 RepID=A0A844YXC5_9SPHN|nr:glycosyltransferase [Alteraurantiacibacter buctensis]MXO71628.1 glycosyltransferase [Alteraurantiacibacter buctensis]